LSLTSLLREPDVRKRFAEEFPKPRIPLQGNIRAKPANPTHAGLIGTALDYLLRVHVAVLNTNIRERQWVAESAIDLLRSRIADRSPIFTDSSRRSTRGVVKRAETIISDARDEYAKCKRRRCVTAKMARCALLLAQLDTYYRCGLLSEQFGRAADSDIRDLRQMLAIAQGLQERPFLASRICVLNPGFKKASLLVNGADADLLIDETLIEVKATKHLRFTSEMFHQLLGYYLLYKIGGITPAVPPRTRIRYLGVYFARYGVFTRLPLDEIIDGARVGAFVRWFKRRAESPFGLERTTIVTEDGTRVTF
jgi:hypothetical protein